MCLQYVIGYINELCLANAKYAVVLHACFRASRRSHDGDSVGVAVVRRNLLTFI